MHGFDWTTPHAPADLMPHHAADQEVQRGCGCIIGKDYPRPIVEHAVASKANMQLMQQAYAAYSNAAAGGASKGDGTQARSGQSGKRKVVDYAGRKGKTPKAS